MTDALRAKVAYLSVSKAAARKGIPPDRIREWFDDGRLSGVRTPEGRRLIDPASLDAYTPDLTVSRAAAELDVSVETIRAWFDAGILTGRRTKGGHRLIDPATVAALKAGRA